MKLPLKEEFVKQSIGKQVEDLYEVLKSLEPKEETKETKKKKNA